MSSPPDMSHDDDALPESIILALGDGLKPAELSQQQRDRMRNRILDRARQSTPEGTTTWRAGDSPWITIAPMVEIRELFRDPQGRTHTSLMRMRPGGVVLPHLHEQEEEFIILEGDCQIGPHFLGAGDAHVAAAGSWHDKVTTRSGVLVLIRGELPYPGEAPEPAVSSVSRS